MKILIITNSSIGLMKFRKELIIRLMKDNQVFIATKFDGCIEEMEMLQPVGIEKIIMELRGTNIQQEVALFFQINRIITKIKPELIITYTVKPNIYGGILARIKKIPYVVNITGLGTTFQKNNWLKKTVIILYRMALKKVKIVFFENEENKKIFIKNRIISDELGYVLHGAGVNIEKFKQKPLPDENISTYIYMGRVMREKGVDELLDAIYTLHKKYPDVKLLVLGKYEENYEKKIQKLVKEGVIEYKGWVKNVEPYIEQAICSILPSYHEGMSNTLLESAAIGRPIITSNIPGCREVVINNKSGYLVEAKNKADLYEKLLRFYELPYGEKVKMGNESRKIVEEKFDKTNVINETISRMGLQ